MRAIVGDVIPGPDELLTYIVSEAERAGWKTLPSRRHLGRLLESARRQDDGSGWPAIEAAALLYTFARDEYCLGEAKTLPRKLAFYQLQGSGLLLREEDVPALRDLQDDIAQGDAGWGHARAWFLEHVVPEGL
jgi:hypothetical protein